MQRSKFSFGCPSHPMHVEICELTINTCRELCYQFSFKAFQLKANQPNLCSTNNRSNLIRKELTSDSRNYHIGRSQYKETNLRLPFCVTNTQNRRLTCINPSPKVMFLSGCPSLCSQLSRITYIHR